MRLPLFARAIAYGVAWLPAMWVTTLFLPKFEAMFDNLRQRGELPRLTECLVWLSWLDRAFFLFPALLLFVLLMVADVRVLEWARRTRRGRVYGVWSASVFVTSGLAFLLAMTALLLPVIKMSESVR